MEYDDKIAQIRKEKRGLERCSLRASASGNLRYLFDYMVLKKIFDVFEEDFSFEYYINLNALSVFDRQGKNNRYNDIVFDKEYIHNGIDMHEVFTRFSNLFKDSDYYFFRNPGTVRINSDERKEIICSYLDYLIPNGSSLYLNLRERFSCLTGVELEDDNLGMTCFLYTRPEASTIFLDSCIINNTINYMLILIHEIMHYYSGIIVNDYGNKNRKALVYGKLAEVLSVYSEFSFVDWLKKNRIFPNGAEFTDNYNLSKYYMFIERFRYYYYCLKNNAKVSIEDDVIKIPENDLKFDSFVSNESLGLNDGIEKDIFQYIIGFLKSFDLLEIEASGEKMDKVFKDFISNITDEKQETSIILNEKNDEAIRKRIKENTEACKRIYRYK